MITPQDIHREERITLFLPRIESLIYPERFPISVEAWHVSGEPVPVAQAEKAEYIPFVVGDSWGELWSTTWFKIEGKVPSGWRKKRVVALVRFALNGHPLLVHEGFTAEGLVYHDGIPGVALNVNRAEVKIPPKSMSGGSFRFLIEAAANGNLTQEWKMLVPKSGDRLFRLAQAELAVVDEGMRNFYFDFKIAMEAMVELPPDSELRAVFRSALHEAVNCCDSLEWKNAHHAVRKVLQRRNGSRKLNITAVGHAHIDTAWLWPLRESIRKCSRTFSTMVDYLKRFPEFRFSCSQAQHYAWMKAHYPTIYRGIRAAVARQQWEPVGSMWVEPDCNMPSGESFIRQILHGKRFFQKEFGVETHDAWLPDAFGFSAALPQILAGCGISSVVSAKLCWNQYNKFPHHTFQWEGIDGTRIFTHFSPSDKYNAEITPKELKYAEENFHQKGKLRNVLMAYGWGDGGGGPTPAHLEGAKRLQALEGFASVELGTVKGFLDKARAERSDMPVWVGELYLELHRGTFTTQSRAKRGNRKSEIALHDAEFLDVAARLLGVSIEEKAPRPPRAIYDVAVNSSVDETTHRGALNRAWRLVLLNQFHDILPGSSIGWVYEDAERDYAAVDEITSQIHANLLRGMAEQVDPKAFKKPVVAFNTLSFDRSEVIALPGGKFQYIHVPSCGYSTFEASPAKKNTPSRPVSLIRSKTGYILENSLIRVKINERGQLTGLFDQEASREVLKQGARANVFQVFPDRPSKHDAWDIDVFYREMMQEMHGGSTIAVQTDDPLRVALRVTHQFGDSRLEQDIVLSAESRRLDFVTHVYWQERHKLLKVAFPVRVHSSFATGEIQFGHVARATHANTPWDAAQFEFCAQRWVDLSETGYGVALLNDCKYGYDVSGSTIRLSLLRSSTMPDPEADQGSHHFTYSLLPHLGPWQQAGVLQQAAALNSPLKLWPLLNAGRQNLPPSLSLFRIEKGTVILETVKRAENSENVILRVYESEGARGEIVLIVPLQHGRAWFTDLLEKRTSEILIASGRICFEIRPFQIATIEIETGEA